MESSPVGIFHATFTGELVYVNRKWCEIAGRSLQRITTPKGEYLAANVTTPGRVASDVLRDSLPREIAALYWPKNMYWRKPAERFVRPVRWQVAMIDGVVLPLEFDGIRAGNMSRGHRILADGAVPISKAGQSYVDALAAAKVLGRERREQQIRKALDAATRKIPGARWREDKTLLETVVNLTEFPSVILGNFDPQFLELPEEVLVTVMRDHQKYFAVEDAGGKLAPHFLAVCDCRRAQLVALQILTEQQTDLAVVIDDQDVRKLVHRASRSATKIPKLATLETTIRALAARARARVTLSGCNKLLLTRRRGRRPGVEAELAVGGRRQQPLVLGQLTQPPAPLIRRGSAREVNIQQEMSRLRVLELLIKARERRRQARRQQAEPLAGACFDQRTGEQQIELATRIRGAQVRTQRRCIASGAPRAPPSSAAPARNAAAPRAPGVTAQRPAHGLPDRRTSARARWRRPSFRNSRDRAAARASARRPPRAMLQACG